MLARDYLGGARAWGTILACYGGGAVLGGLFTLGRHPRRPLLAANLSMLGFTLPPLALALRLPVVAVMAGALLASLGSAVGSALWTTVQQQRVPPEALSRVGAFSTVGAFAFGPAAFVLAGPAAAAFGAGTVLGFGAAWGAFMTVALFAVPSVRQLTWATWPPGRRGYRARYRPA